MPGPKLPPVAMTAEERAALERLARRPTPGSYLRSEPGSYCWQLIG